MIRAEFLRLENNLLINDINEVCKITSISKKYIGYETKSRTGECLIDCLTPIELSEEILLKCGFEKRQQTNSSNFFTFGFGDNPITRDWIIVIKYFKDENKFFYNNGFHIIKHLHQLQNLYFALTNEELTVNL